MYLRWWRSRSAAWCSGTWPGSRWPILIGEWEFCGLPLDIDRQVLIPRSDTETLVDCALPFLRANPGSRVLDLCTGSGCVGLAVASQVPDCR
ncbi:MAG: hypothetical protein ACLUNQ_01015 [Oscillospiraceae bacterium]